MHVWNLKHREKLLYSLTCMNMTIVGSYILPAEKALLDSLNMEQMVLVAEWISLEKQLIDIEDCHPAVSRKLRNMTHQLRSLAQLKQLQAML